MPTNKNAFIRYKYLDRLLSDRHHHYDIHDLTDRVNAMLYDNGFKEVTQRCIEKDLEALTQSPFRSPIERVKHNGRSIIRYSDRSFSIFSEELSNEERHLLHEVLSTLGQFDGLSHFEWLDKFKVGLGLVSRRQIISFSNNPYLLNSTLLGTLFDHIANEVVIRLSYHTFADPTVRSIVFHPYVLKQYNDRWFLLGAADDDGKILTFALDRIDDVAPLPGKKYAPCPDNLSDRFEDIVGVTLYEDRPIEHIVFWCSDSAKDYVSTKPLHGSQIRYNEEDNFRLHDKYPFLEGGEFFSIDCKRNPELISLLSSYGENLIVLEPTEIQDSIFERSSKMTERYKKLHS